MATLVGHGGNCCGMKHLHTFRDNDEANARELTRLTNSVANGNYNLEVILSNRQAQQYPLLIAELARLGYVYTTAFSGQHGTPVHVFHRAQRRLALNAQGFRWNGMTANAGISGNLPPMNERAARPPRADNYLGIRQGSRVRINSPASRRHGREFVVIRRGREPQRFGGYAYKAYMEDEGVEFGIIVANCVPLGVAAPVRITRDTDNLPALLEAGVTRLRIEVGHRAGEVVTYRATPAIDHEYIRPHHNFNCLEHAGLVNFTSCTILPAEEGVAPAAERREYLHPVVDAGPAPAAPPADPILNEVFALFADGRVRGPFEYTREVREAYPRVARYRRRRVFADGNITTEDARMPR